METEDVINLPPASSSEEIDKNDLHNTHCEAGEANSEPTNSKVKEDKLDAEILGDKSEVGNEDSQHFLATASENDLGDNLSVLQAKVELTETVAVAEKEYCFSSGVRSENGYLNGLEGSPNNHKRDGGPINKHEVDGNSTSGDKRARLTVTEQQPTVHVIYNSLTRDSKQKLEELLQQWSEWQTKHCSSSHGSNEVLESGEKAYFSALHVGLDKPSAVSFWMDNQMRNERSKEFIPLDSNSVPLYDRGYSLALTSADGSSNLEGHRLRIYPLKLKCFFVVSRYLGLGEFDASRCFNCGSYNHSLKDCPKPRDNAAVNNARKQLKSRRNQNASSRNPTRYYQNSPGGKYDGLMPGILGAETRQLLGLGELDPPPWLNRMRRIGYPPGYLDPVDDDQPSGITIFGDEEISEEKEDGEILERQYLELSRKKSVDFPGMNAPIPENADERRWAVGPSNSDQPRGRSNRRFNNPSSESIGRDQYREQRWSRDYRDEGPPGCDPQFSPNLSSYSPRYGNNESNYTSHSARDYNQVTRSPSFGRSPSDRDRRSPLVHENSSNYDSYSSLPFSPSRRMRSPQNYGSGSFENRDDESRDYFTRESISHRRDKHDTHLHHRRR